ncbi:hypothetical protein HMPREF1551_00167 [Capnocytophaga sp. oral taxon 863 str. F0517]|nr:hypothetical protein HMPREF1551_00167 [Capnocytophaga sp. oral taxon 863 str. F0517]
MVRVYHDPLFWYWSFQGVKIIKNTDSKKYFSIFIFKHTSVLSTFFRKAKPYRSVK